MRNMGIFVVLFEKRVDLQYGVWQTGDKKKKGGLDMSFKHEPIPAAAEAAGMTKLVFAEDFESDKAIDFSGEGKEGYSFYADRPYNLPTCTREECQMRDSVLYFAPQEGRAAIGIPTYSKTSKTGFLMRYGYAEARIRADLPTDEYAGWPAFWGISINNVMAQPFVHCGELDILEMYDPKAKGRSGGIRKDIIYTGTMHDWWRIGGVDEKGNPNTVYAWNAINNCGYQDRFDYIDDQWHTYAALWEPGYVAWYLDGKLMHSARYNDTDLPEYYYRDDPTPLPRDPDEDAAARKGTWHGAHSIMDTEDMVLFLGADKNWPMEVDWVRVWQK